MLLALEVVVRSLRLGEGEDLVDDGLQPIRLDGAVHRLEHLRAADIEPLDLEVAPQDRHRIERRHAREQPDHRDRAAEPGRQEGARQGAGAADLDRDVGAAAAGQLQRFLVPVGRRLVVDHGLGPHLLQPFGLGRRTRGADDARAEHLRELQREDRDSAGTLDLHDVARLEMTDLDQRVPGRDCGTGQGGAFLVAEMRRQLHDAFLLQHREFGQHAVDRATHGRRHGALADGAAEPTLHEASGDPVADLDPADPRADRHDLAGAVRQRDQVGLGGGPRILGLDREQIAVVQGAGHDPHQHLPRSRRRIRPLGQGERLDALGGRDDVALHLASPFSSMMVLAMTASWSQGNRIQVSWLTSVT